MHRFGCSIGVCLSMLVGFQSFAADIRPDPLPLNQKNWPAGVVASSQLPKNRAFDYSFSDVPTTRIEKWLSYVGVKIPVKVSGLLSGWVWAQRSERGWLNFAGYRIEGEVTSPSLHVEQWEIKSARLRFGFANNVWYVGQLSGDFYTNNASESLGSANFSATLPNDDNRLLQLSGSIDRSKLKPLLQAFDIDFEIANEMGEASIAANVPLTQVGDPAAWKSKASIDLSGVRSKEIPRSDLFAEIDIATGEWRIPSGTLTIIDQQVTFEGSGPLDRRLPYMASIAGKQLSIGQLLRAAKLPQLDSLVSGNVDIVGKIQGNIDRLVEAASAAVRSQSLVVGGEVIQSVLVEGVLDNYIAGRESLQLDVKSLAISGGTLDGKLSWASLHSLKQLIPDEAEINLKSFDLARLPGSLTRVEWRGIANGRLQIASQFDAKMRRHPWSVDSQLTVEKLSIMNTEFGTATLNAHKDIDTDRIKATFESAEKSLHAFVDIAIASSLEAGFLESIESYSASGSIDHFSTAMAMDDNRIAIPISVTGKFELQGTQRNWLKTGHAELSQLNVQLPEQSFELTDVVVNILEDAIRLEQFRIHDASEGRVAGSALIRRDSNGEHLLNLRIMDLEVEPYLKSLAPAEFQGLVGSIDLETRLKKAANSHDYLGFWLGNIRGEISKIEYRSTPIGHVTIDAETDGVQVKGEVAGRVLEGELTLNGVFAIEDLKHPVADRNNFPIDASIVGVDLKRLMSVIVGPRLGNLYNGVANLELKSLDQSDDWEIQMSVPSFHYGRLELAKELIARMICRSDKLLVIEDVAGSLAGGRIKVQGELQTMSEEPTGTLRFSADQLDVQSLAVLFYPAYAKFYSGDLTYRGNIQIGNDVVFIGNSHFKNSLIYGLPIQDVRNDLTMNVSLNGEMKEISARNVHGTAIGGRFDGEGRIRGGANYSLDANGRIGGGKLEQLSRALGFQHIVGSGSFDATARLTSKDAFNLSALAGPMQLEFKNGDVKSVPVLSEIGRLVPVLQLASTDIKSGTMHGQFGQGQFHIPDLVLNSDAFYLVANGSTSLRSGGLFFDGLLQTGGSIETQIAQGATQKLLTAAFPELVIFTQINDLVRNRTVFFHIGGTSKHPVVQPKAAQTVIKGLLQNFSRRLIVIPSASTTIAVPNNN